MPLILAPYNQAMRLGMGFNSYTQTLCINDVVQKRGGVKASESDLKQRDHAADASKNAKTITAAQGGDTVTEIKDQHIGEDVGSGTVVIKRAGLDEQNVVSQVVTWEARFVDSMSDITNKLNISGSLAIKISAMSEGGGVEAKANFLDEKLFSTGRKNYHIHVKVVNQHLYAEEVTEFMPLKNVQPGQFTDVYGDSYISGFLEGGEFDAVVSFDTTTDSTKWEVGGSIKAHFKTTGVEVSGTAEGGKVENSSKVDMTTDVKVSWSGGGDIKKNDIKKWEIAELMAVAMEFPDRVAACPQRINAIVTKYTSLRSFHEKTSLGSPLDYENAGIYTSSLLDAYMEYKLLWRQIQTLTADYEANIGTIKLAPEVAGFSSYATEMKVVYDTQLLAYNNSQTPQQTRDVTIWREQSAKSEKKERPLLPNHVKPYAPDIVGLDKAKRECRFEMIKIVREVDAVSRDPQIAVDPERNWQYLTPSIFKRLLPIKEDGPPLPDRKEWTALRDKSKADEDALKAKNTELEKKTEELEELKSKLRSVILAPRKTGPSKLAAASADKPRHAALQTSIETHSHKVDEFRMADLIGQEQSAASKSKFFNDLDVLNVNHKPKKLMIWSNPTRISGLKLSYNDGTERSHGSTEGNPQHTLDVASDGSEDITEVQFEEVRAEDGQLCLARIHAATSNCRVTAAVTPPKSEPAKIEAPKTDSPTIDPPKAEATTAEVTSGETPKPATTQQDAPPAVTTSQQSETPTPAPEQVKEEPLKVADRTHNFAMTDDRQWSLKGFYGFHNDGVIESLGVIWGRDRRDEAIRSAQHPPAKNFLALPKPLQLKTKEALASRTSRRGHAMFYLGGMLSTGTKPVAGGPIVHVFSALDEIQADWTIASIGFSASESATQQLKGLKVTYTNGQSVTHGSFSLADESWSCGVDSPIIAAKLTVGKYEDGNFAFMHGVELVRGEDDGEMPIWPLDVNTIRYKGIMSKQPEREKKVITLDKLVERAPMLGRENWSLRGFYGEETQGCISRLGPIWGCG